MAKVVRTPGPGAAKLQKILVAIDTNGLVGKVGWPLSAKYENGMLAAYAATISEFGCPEKGIPKRPFVQPTIQKKQLSWRALIQEGGRAIVKGNVTIKEVLKRVGLQAAGDIRVTISKLTNPPLAAATIKARMNRREDKKTVGGLNKPLVDSQLMLNSLTSTVEKK